MIDKGPGGWFRAVPGGKQRMRLNVIETPVGKQSDKFSGVEILAEGWQARDRDSKTRSYRAHCDLGSVDRNLSLRLNPHSTAVSMKKQLLAGERPGDHKDMAVKLLGCLRAPIRFKIGGGRDDD